MAGIVDYLCNSFLPWRADEWDRMIAAQGVPLKVRRDPADAFAEPGAVVAKMDDLGIATLVLSVAEPHTSPYPFQFHEIACTEDEAALLVADYPGRFAALWAINPDAGMRGVRRAERALEHPWVVGFYNHTHSFDRRFDHADFYPFYALAAEHEVPIAMQAGTSGGLMPSECGVPIGVDRPAIYFPDTTFLLSHTGWPWVTETISMALKHSNVYIGTAAYPPKHWSPELVEFIKGPGRRKVVFGTNFPTVGHRHALGQLDQLDLPDTVRHDLLEGTARAIFHRLEKEAR